MGYWIAGWVLFLAALVALLRRSVWIERQLEKRHALRRDHD